MAEVITTDHPDGSVTTTVIEAGRRFSARTTPQEAARLALALYDKAPAVVGFGGEIPNVKQKPMREYKHAAETGWAQLSNAQRRQHGSIEKWWGSIGKDARVSSRASFAALQAERPNDTPAQASAWWGSIGKNARVRLREKHNPGYGDDLFDDIAKITRDAAKVVKVIAPAARAIPGYGPLLAAGIERYADAAASITDPKKALAMLAGGPDALKALALVRGASVSKVLGQAANEIAAYAPAAAAKMDATSKLNLSSIAAGIGAPQNAQKLIAAAKQSATAKLAKQGQPSAAQVASLMSQANTARKRLLTSNAGAAARGSQAPSDIAAAARAGRVRSNRGGPVTPDELAAAAAAGRVFFVS